MGNKLHQNIRTCFITWLHGFMTVHVWWEINGALSVVISFMTRSDFRRQIHRTRLWNMHRAIQKKINIFLFCDWYQIPLLFLSLAMTTSKITSTQENVIKRQFTPCQGRDFWFTLWYRHRISVKHGISWSEALHVLLGLFIYINSTEKGHVFMTSQETTKNFWMKIWFLSLRKLDYIFLIHKFKNIH